MFMAWMPSVEVSSSTSMISSCVAPDLQRALDVLTDAGHVQVRRRGVDGDVHELLGFVVQVVLLPRDGGEIEVGAHELGSSWSIVSQ